MRHASTPVEKASILDSIMFYCTKCGERRPSNEAQICPNCGAEFKNGAPTLIGIGSFLPSDDSFQDRLESATIPEILHRDSAPPPNLLRVMAGKENNLAQEARVKQEYSQPKEPKSVRKPRVRITESIVIWSWEIILLWIVALVAAAIAAVLYISQ